MSSSGCSTPRSGPAGPRDDELLSDSSSSLSDAAASGSEVSHSLAPAKQKQSAVSTPEQQASAAPTPKKRASASLTPTPERKKRGKITSDYAPCRPRRSTHATQVAGGLELLSATVPPSAEAQARRNEQKRQAEEHGRRWVRGYAYVPVAQPDVGGSAAAESSTSALAVEDDTAGVSTSAPAIEGPAADSSTSTMAIDSAAAGRSTSTSSADVAAVESSTSTAAIDGTAAESSASTSGADGVASKRLATASPTPEIPAHDCSQEASASPLAASKRRSDASTSSAMPQSAPRLPESSDDESYVPVPRKKKIVRPRVVVSDDEPDSSQLSDAPSEVSVALSIAERDSDSDERMETSATSQSSTERSIGKRRQRVSFAKPGASSEAAEASLQSAPLQSPQQASPPRSRSRGQKVIDYSQTNHPPEAFSDSDEAGPSRKKVKASSSKTQKKTAAASPKAPKAPRAARAKSSTVSNSERVVRQRAMNARETLADGTVVERQIFSCKSPRYAGHTRCIQCIKRQGNDGCRFLGIRVFPVQAAVIPIATSSTSGPSAAGAITKSAPSDEAAAAASHEAVPSDQTAPLHQNAPSDQSVPSAMDSTDLAEGGDPFFLSQSRAEELPDFPLSADLNRPMDERSASLILSTAARHLQPLLEAEIEHAKLPGCLRRNRILSDVLTCDFCSTSLFSSSYFCDACGYELCTECIETLRELGEHPKAEGLAACTAKRDADYKLMRRAHPVARFVPATRLDTAELQAELQAMQEAVADTRVDEPAPAVPTDAAGASAASASPASMPAHVVSHQVARLKKDTMDEDAFLAVWALGQPLVVEGVTPAEVWDPAKFIAMHGSEQCMIVRCDKDGGEKIVTVAKFFETFGLPPDEKQELLGSGIWKLKDWPPSAEFAQAFPLLNADFNRSVPMPDFTRRDGRKNIAALFPTNGNAPDLGPKMYNAWPGQLTKGGKGSTRLHMDVADAVNTMLHAAEPPTPDAPRAAAWDLFRTEDAGILRQFLRDKFSLSADGVDPIHTQQHYLDETLLAELYAKHSIKPWRVYQQQGEAVFIPAGCAHQVCNLTDCIKVAVDFISPHSVGRCFKLTQEFRGMSEGNKKSWKQDILQLRAQLWFAWRALRTLEEREAAAAAAKLASADSKPAEDQAIGAQPMAGPFAAPPSLPDATAGDQPMPAGFAALPSLPDADTGAQPLAALSPSLPDASAAVTQETAPSGAPSAIKPEGTPPLRVPFKSDTLAA